MTFVGVATWGELPLAGGSRGDDSKVALKSYAKVARRTFRSQGQTLVRSMISRY